MGTHFFWDPVEDNIIQERDDTGAVTADYTTEPYLYGDLISQRRSGESRFYCFDGQGSTRALTDSTGNVTDTTSYTAFGEVSERAGSTENSFQYVGQKGYCRCVTLARYNVRRRPLSAAEGRWLTVDPIETDTDGVNRNLSRQPIVRQFYNYARNSPLVRVDPSGLICYEYREAESPQRHFDCDADLLFGKAFRWDIAWKPDDGSQGYIIQRIEHTLLAWKCDRSAYEATRSCPEPNAAATAPKEGEVPIVHPHVYWEIWYVRNGKVMAGPRNAPISSDSDTWSLSDVRGFFGHFEIKGVAYFLPTPIDPLAAAPPGGWGMWKHDPTGPSRNALLTCDKPEFRSTILRPFAIRRLVASWCCCEDRIDVGREEGITVALFNQRGRCS